MKRAIFPGSFDPITLGHLDIIERGVTVFDELIIAIGVNSDKKYMFSLDCLLYTSPSPRDLSTSRMPSSA